MLGRTKTGYVVGSTIKPYIGLSTYVLIRLNVQLTQIGKDLVSGLFLFDTSGRE
jgi:hypothetical protein